MTPARSGARSGADESGAVVALDDGGATVVVPVLLDGGGPSVVPPVVLLAGALVEAGGSPVPPVPGPQACSRTHSSSARTRRTRRPPP